MDASENLILPRRFLRMCRAHWGRPKLADSTGQQLTGGELFLRTLILRRLLSREALGADERFVGVLLPPTVGAVLANAALAIDRRVAVNLNYTMSPEVMNDCIAQCGIKHVITSRRVLDKLRERFTIELKADVVYLEDLKDKVSLIDKLVAAMAAAAPVAMVERRLGLDQVKADDLLTVIFTSGATGRPKGVMLSHANVGSNVEAINAVAHLLDEDVLLGVLPMFHSFGYTVTLWTVLTMGLMGVYHYSPLEAREVGKMARRHGATILISTPTFLRSYLRRCEKEDFARLQVVVAGAEKMPRELSDAFEQAFGARPVEGYGATELSPVASCNIPLCRAREDQRDGVREGTVGRPLPGVKAKVVDLDTNEDLGADRSGMLLISGPGVMQGYLGQEQLTRDAIRDGWYVTGDVATIDADGFITITGRLARFSKLGGEMVPHIRVEEAITHALAIPEDELRVVVTAVPDSRKGERLVVLHTGISQTPEDICRTLQTSGLPALWLPSADSFRQIDAIPVLGTGKLDLKRVKDMAADLFRGGG